MLPFVTEWLVREIDQACLEQAESRPGDDRSQVPTELESLQKAMGDVTARIDKGNEAYLEAPANLRHGLIAKLQSWELEREELERRQRNLTVTDGEVSAFARWWSKVKQNLVMVRGVSDEGADPMAFLKPGVSRLYLAGERVVLVEFSRFRQVMRDLGFTATIFWKPDGNRFFTAFRKSPMTMNVTI